MKKTIVVGYQRHTRKISLSAVAAKERCFGCENADGISRKMASHHCDKLAQMTDYHHMGMFTIHYL